MREPSEDQMVLYSQFGDATKERRNAEFKLQFASCKSNAGAIMTKSLKKLRKAEERWKTGETCGEGEEPDLTQESATSSSQFLERVRDECGKVSKRFKKLEKKRRKQAEHEETICDLILYKVLSKDDRELVSHRPKTLAEYCEALNEAFPFEQTEDQVTDRQQDFVRRFSWNSKKTMQQNVNEFEKLFQYHTVGDKALGRKPFPISKSTKFKIFNSAMVKADSMSVRQFGVGNSETESYAKTLLRIKKLVEMNAQYFVVQRRSGKNENAFVVSEEATDVRSDELICSESHEAEQVGGAYFICETENPCMEDFDNASISAELQRCKNCKGFKHMTSTCPKFGGGLFFSEEAIKFRQAVRARNAQRDSRMDHRGGGQGGGHRGGGHRQGQALVVTEAARSQESLLKAVISCAATLPKNLQNKVKALKATDGGTDFAMMVVEESDSSESEEDSSESEDDDAEDRTDSDEAIAMLVQQLEKEDVKRDQLNKSRQEMSVAEALVEVEQTQAKVQFSKLALGGSYGSQARGEAVVQGNLDLFAKGQVRVQEEQRMKVEEPERHEAVMLKKAREQAAQRAAVARAVKADRDLARTCAEEVKPRGAGGSKLQGMMRPGLSKSARKAAQLVAKKNKKTWVIKVGANGEQTMDKLILEPGVSKSSLKSAQLVVQLERSDGGQVQGTKIKFKEPVKVVGQLPCSKLGGEKLRCAYCFCFGHSTTRGKNGRPLRCANMVAHNKDFEAKRLAISKSAKMSASKPAFKKPFGPISGSDSKKRLDVAPAPVKVRSAKGQKKASYKARKLAKTFEQTSQIMETSVAGESSLLAQLSHFQAHAVALRKCKDEAGKRCGEVQCSLLGVQTCHAGGQRPAGYCAVCRRVYREKESDHNASSKHIAAVVATRVKAEAIEASSEHAMAIQEQERTAEAEMLDVGNAFAASAVDSLPRVVAKEIEIVMDTGASRHYFKPEVIPFLTNSKKCRRVVKAATGQAMDVTMKGDLMGTVQGSESRVPLAGVIKDVSSVNGICANLYSIIQGLKCGNEFHFTPDGSYCQLKGRMVKIPIKVKNDPPRLVMDMKISKEPIARSAEAVAKSMAANALIHRRCAHVSHKNLSHLVKQGLVQGLRYDAALTPDCLCRVCTVATSARSPFDTEGVRRAQHCGARLHGDIKGRMRNASIDGGCRYSFFAVDDKSRFKLEFFMKSRKEMPKYVKRALDECARQGHAVSYFRLDNEFDTKEMREMLAEKRVSPEFSAPRRQQQNGVAERSIRTWFKMIRGCLLDQGRPKSYWKMAAQCCTFIQNRIFTSACPDAVPAEEWFGQTISAKHWRVPLCTVFFHRDKEERMQSSKGDSTCLEDQRSEGVLAGYTEDARCYLCYCPKRKITYRRRYEECEFDERSKLTADDRAYYDIDGTDIPVEAMQEFQDDFEESVELPEGHGGGVRVENSANNSDSDADHEDVNENLGGVSDQEAGDALVEEPADELQAGVDESGSNPVGDDGSESDDEDPDDDSESKVASNSESDSEPESEADELDDDQFFQHELAKKETLGQVCKKFGITMEILEAYNDGLGVDSQGITHKLKKSMMLRSIDGIRPASVNIPIAQSMACFSTEVASSGSELETKAEECTDVLQQAKVKAKQREYARLAISVITQQPGEVCYFVGMGNIVIPKSQAQARNSPQADKWQEAEGIEMEKLAKFDTFKDVETAQVIDDGYEVNNLIWNYRIKIDDDGNPSFRARVCFNGAKEKQDCYGDISSPVLKPLSAKLIDITAAHQRWPLHNSDVTSAFVQVPCERSVYAHYPIGSGERGHCMQIVKYLYGQKGAPKAFYDLLREFLVEGLGAKMSVQDECLFRFDLKSSSKQGAAKVKQGQSSEGGAALDADGKTVAKLEVPSHDSAEPCAFVGIYVDDLKYTGPPEFVKEFEKRLRDRFPITGECEEKKFLGVETFRNIEDQIIEKSMEGAITRFTQQWNLTDSKGFNTPMEQHLHLSPCEGADEVLDESGIQEFQSKIGSLMHFCVHIRNDVEFPTKQLARYMQKPGRKHMKVADRVISYLYHTRTLRKTFDCKKPLVDEIMALVDSNWASSWDAKSTSSGVIMGNGAALVSLVKLQKLPAHSSCEAELIAMDDIVREIAFMLNLMKEFGMKLKKPLVILEDNQSTISLCYNKVQNQRSKHIDVRYFYIRHLIRIGLVQVKWIPSEHNTADCGTKPLGQVLFRRHVEIMFGKKAVKVEFVKDVRSRKS